MPDVILIRNQYPDAAALHRVLDYVCHSGMIGGYAVDPVYAFREFMLVKSTSADSMIFSRSAIFCSTRPNIPITHFELCRFGCIDSPQQECYHEIKTGQEKRKANDIESIKSGEFCRDHHCWRRWSLALPPAGYGLDPAHPCDITEGRADG